MTLAFAEQTDDRSWPPTKEETTRSLETLLPLCLCVSALHASQNRIESERGRRGTDREQTLIARRADKKGGRRGRPQFMKPKWVRLFCRVAFAVSRPGLLMRSFRMSAPCAIPHVPLCISLAVMLGRRSV
jgi:hypothetical protein